MTRAEAIKAVKRYCSRGWPVSSLTVDGTWRAAWAASHLPNLSLIHFMELVQAEGFSPRQYGGENGPWILRLPGRQSKRLVDGAIKCMGV